MNKFSELDEENERTEIRKGFPGEIDGGKCTNVGMAKYWLFFFPVFLCSFLLWDSSFPLQFHLAPLDGGSIEKE